MLYNDWLPEWLESYVRPSLKYNTYKRYKEVVFQHIAKRLGEYDIDAITPDLLQRYISELLRCGNIKTGRGLSSNSVNGIICVIQGSLKSAYLAGNAGHYVADRVKRPKIIECTVECLSLTEQKKIERAILSEKPGKMFGIVLCMYSGLRLGELLALEWKDIDIGRGVIYVTKTCYDARSKDGKFVRMTDAPKTETSRRTIPFPKQLKPILKELKKTSAGNWVITSSSGRAISVRGYQRSFELLLKKLNLPHKRFHALRHTFATRALECGMDVKTLAEILGHKNPIVTLKRYAHSLSEHKIAMMNKVGRLIEQPDTF